MLRRSVSHLAPPMRGEGIALKGTLSEIWTAAGSCKINS